MPIKITFDSASGLGEGTKIKYHGITVGEVESVAFSSSLEQVILSARLDDNAATLAREGTQFWVVKAEFGLAAIANLGTLVTGDYIAIRPTEEGGNPASRVCRLKKTPR